MAKKPLQSRSYLLEKETIRLIEEKAERDERSRNYVVNKVLKTALSQGDECCEAGN